MSDLHMKIFLVAPKSNCSFSSIWSTPIGLGHSSLLFERTLWHGVSCLVDTSVVSINRCFRKYSGKVVEVVQRKLSTLPQPRNNPKHGKCTRGPINWMARFVHCLGRNGPPNKQRCIELASWNSFDSHLLSWIGCDYSAARKLQTSARVQHSKDHKCMAQ